MNTPSLQAQFERNAFFNGVQLRLSYAGAWTRNGTSGAVARAAVSPSALQTAGFTAFKVTGSDYLKERVAKWGATFAPNATVLLPLRFPTANLTTIQDLRNPSAPPLEVILAAPATLSEGIYNLVWCRSESPYNKRITVLLQNRRGNGRRVYMTGVPARISFPAATSATAGQTDVNTQTDTITPNCDPVLEMPLVYDDQGALIQFDPSATFIVDAPSVTLGADGQPALDALTYYRVESPVAWSGGEIANASRYQLSLVAD